MKGQYRIDKVLGVSFRKVAFTKGTMSTYDIIIVLSRHVESVILLQRLNS